MNTRMFMNGGIYFGEPNLYIGGVASVIYNETELAKYVSCNESDINNFTINGDDIECNISVFYNVTGFNGTSNSLRFITTYFRETDGNCLSLGSWQFNHVSEISAPGVTQIGGLTFSYCIKLASLDLPNLQEINGNFAINRTQLRQLYFPELIEVYNQAFRVEVDAPYLLIYAPKLATIGVTVDTNEFMFVRTLAECNILTHFNNRTINSGGVEGDLGVAQTLGATLLWSDAIPTDILIKPNKVENITIDFNTHARVKVIYDSPTGSTNTIHSYEVWHNGIWYKHTARNEVWFADLTQGSSHDCVVYAIDIYGNKSEPESISFVVASDLVPTSTFMMKAYLKLDDVIGATVYDSFNDITYPCTGTLQQTGVIGTAVNFTKGSNQRIDMGKPFNTQDLTVSFWIRVNSYNTRASVFHYDYDKQGTINVETNGALRWYYGQSANQISTPAIFNGHLGEWFYVTAVRDALFGEITIYINGVVEASVTLANEYTFLDSVENMWIGDGYAGDFDGDIDEFSIYDRAWHSEEVLLNYNGGLGRTY